MKTQAPTNEPPKNKVLEPFNVTPGNWANGVDYEVLGVPGGCIVFHGNVGVFVPINL